MKRKMENGKGKKCTRIAVVCLVLVRVGQKKISRRIGGRKQLRRAGIHGGRTFARAHTHTPLPSSHFRPMTGSGAFTHLCGGEGEIVCLEGLGRMGCVSGDSVSGGWRGGSGRQSGCLEMGSSKVAKGCLPGLVLCVEVQGLTKGGRGWGFVFGDQKMPRFL